MKELVSVKQSGKMLFISRFVSYENAIQDQRALVFLELIDLLKNSLDELNSKHLNAKEKGVLLDLIEQSKSELLQTP